ncbi:uncharacterized protein TNCV_2718421 [Trichonephila clavipes]|nr:uncharacterized protein TNCV_2718421 [Trichonephila clavipes]
MQCYWVNSRNEPIFLRILRLSVSIHSIWLHAHKKELIRFSNFVQNRYPEMMARRKYLSPDEIPNLLRKISENELDGSKLSCSNLDSDQDIRLNENDCEKFKGSAEIIDNILVNSDMYIYLGNAQNGYRIMVLFLADLRLEKSNQKFFH